MGRDRPRARVGARREREPRQKGREGSEGCPPQASRAESPRPHASCTAVPARLLRVPLSPRLPRTTRGLPLRLVHWREGRHAPRLVRVLGVLQGLSAESYIEIVVLQLHSTHNTHKKILNRQARPFPSK